MFRVQIVDALEQQPCPVSPHANLKSSLSPSDHPPSRHLLHAPVPCRPQPIKSNPILLQWASSPPTSQLFKPSSSKSQPLHLSSVPAAGPYDGPRRPGPAHAWHHKQGVPKASDAEPTVLFRLRSLPEPSASHSKHHAKKETSPLMVEKVPEDEPREPLDGPLDLSRASQSPSDFSAAAGSGAERTSPDTDVKAQPYMCGSTSPHSGASPASSPRPAGRQHEEEPEGGHDSKVIRACEGTSF